MLTALGDKKLISQYLLDFASNDYVVKPSDLDEAPPESPYNYAKVVNISQKQQKTENLLQNFKNNLNLDADSHQQHNSKPFALQRKSARFFKCCSIILKNLHQGRTHELIWEESYLLKTYQHSSKHLQKLHQLIQIMSTLKPFGELVFNKRRQIMSYILISILLLTNIIFAISLICYYIAIRDLRDKSKKRFALVA